MCDCKRRGNGITDVKAALSAVINTDNIVKINEEYMYRTR